MRSYWRWKKSATVHDLARYVNWWSKLQHGLHTTESIHSSDKSEIQHRKRWCRGSEGAKLRSVGLPWWRCPCRQCLRYHQSRRLRQYGCLRQCIHRKHFCHHRRWWQSARHFYASLAKVPVTRLHSAQRYRHKSAPSWSTRAKPSIRTLLRRPRWTWQTGYKWLWVARREKYETQIAVSLCRQYPATCLTGQPLVQWKQYLFSQKTLKALNEKESKKGGRTSGKR